MSGTCALEKKEKPGTDLAMHDEKATFTIMMNHTAMATSVLQHSRFDLKEFQDKWKKSRLSALKEVLGEKSAGISDEELLLKQVDTETKEKVLRKVFDNSRRLGLSVAKYLGLSWETSDLADLLPHVHVPCFSHPWRKHNSAYVLERSGCESFSKTGSLGCDYWREALDGLVMGVGENERLSRHRSMGHGDSECLDVIFTEVFHPPRVVSATDPAESKKVSQKFGPLPENMSESLKPITRHFESMKIKLTLEGLSEGILYYRLDANEGVLCGAGGKLMHDSFSREMAKLYPNIAIRDVAPLAVYGGSS